VSAPITPARDAPLPHPAGGPVARAQLAARWAALREAQPGLRARDAATTLGVSEAELVASHLGSGATLLDGDAASLLHALPAVGRCLALTRNERAVSEVRGEYGGVALGRHAGQVVGDGIDLRVFLGHWGPTFAVEEPHPQRAGELRRSIQVFDRAGVAVHKVYLEEAGDARAWSAIVAVRATPAPAALALEPPRSPPPERPDPDVDVPALRAAWDAMTDTHDFVHVLGAHGVSRPQALRLAGSARARPVARAALSEVLHAVAQRGDRIMIFVGNRGCLQVFTGAVQRVVRAGPWLNVLDAGFNLHVREDHLAESWVVDKPTRAGVVRSLELFDGRGETIALVLSARADRQRPEDPAWHALLAGLAPASSPGGSR
jgi:putative hemin transport protein